MRLQVPANPTQVGLQSLRVCVVAAVMRQHVVQVKVQDVGVDAADLQVILETVRGQSRSLLWRFSDGGTDTHLIWLDVGQQTDTGVILLPLSLNTEKQTINNPYGKVIRRQTKEVSVWICVVLHQRS